MSGAEITVMTTKKILVSACLLGERVRYDGNTLALSDKKLQSWVDKGWVVPVCPEVDAGMAIPRIPAEITNDDGYKVLNGQARVITQSGSDVTVFFKQGAAIALELCLKNNIQVAVLSESSPSCGSNTIYNGEFTATKVKGVGVTTALLQQNGIQVFSQFELEKAFSVAENVISSQ